MWKLGGKGITANLDCYFFSSILYYVKIENTKNFFFSMILFLGILLFTVDTDINFSTLCNYVEQPIYFHKCWSDSFWE